MYAHNKPFKHLFTTKIINVCRTAQQYTVGHSFLGTTYFMNFAFLNQVRTWFFEIAFVREVGMCVCACVCACVCVCVCVCACVHVCVRPRGHKLHSHDIKPVQPAEQVCCI